MSAAVNGSPSPTDTFTFGWGWMFVAEDIDDLGLTLCCKVAMRSHVPARLIVMAGRSLNPFPASAGSTERKA